MGDVARVNRGGGLYAKAGFLSRFTFSWLTPVVQKARKGESIADDISHPEHLDAEKACQEFIVHWEREKKNKNPSLIRAIRSCYKNDFIKAVLVKLCWSACLLMAAFYFVRRLVTIVSDARKGVEDRETEGWVLACFFFVCCALLSFAQQQMLRITQDTGVKLRAALTTAIYRKALKLERAAEESTVVLNLATNDCQRLMEACTSLHALWSSPMEALTIVILLIVLVGVWGLVALGLVCSLLFAQVWAAQRVSYLRNKTIQATDSRVRVMAELLAAIKLVKLYAWEDSFLDEVRKLRKKETKYIRKGNVYKSWNLMSVFALPPIIAVVLFSLYQWDEGKLPSTIAFTTLSLFNTLRFPLVILPKAIKNLAEARAAVRRVQMMLLEPEIIPVERKAEPGSITFNDVGIGYLKPADAIAKAHTVKVLHHIFFEVTQGEKAALVSAVGGGKTSVLLAALGEARVLRGSVDVKGRIAYVPQNPWIFAGTMRSNIVFGRPFDQARYDTVVKACALEDDFRIASHGDATMVAERGINLSGGQRQRLSIARAVYGDADLFLFDNPLSAVDWHTSQHIMTNCVEGLLKSKTVLMATHQIHLLERFQRVVVLKDRTVVYQGPYDLHELRLQMPEYFQEDEQHSSPVKQRRKQPSSVPTIAEHEGEAPVNAKQNMSSGHVEEQDHKHTEQQPAATETQSHAKPLPQNQPAVKEELQAQPTSVTQMLSLLNPDQRPVSATTAYIRTGGYLVVALSAFSFMFTQTNRIISDWWISQWTGDTQHLSKLTYNYIYIGLVIGFMINLLIRGITFYRVAIRIGTRMHNLFYGRVLKAPLAFFSVMPLGDLLNTFSRDQDTIDETLPDVMHLTFIYLLILVTTITLVCVVLPPYVAVGGSLFLFTIFVVKYYIKAGLYLRKLANETAAPVFSQLSESLRGIVVVRAFGMSNGMERLNASLLDYHHDAVFYLNQLSLWLAFRLDLMGATLVGATALLSVAERNQMSEAITGLAISNSLQALVFFTWMARGLSDVAALFSSVDNMENLTVNLPQENDPHAPKSDQSDPNNQQGLESAYSKIAEMDQPTAVDKNLEMVVVEKQSPKYKAKWPTEGVIQFNDVYIRYLPWLPPALRGLDFSVRPREKIGVVGRTGAGKSSLIMAIYRMFPIERGTITIDGRDLSEMSLQELRSSLSIIPQEPVMFHGTIRSNLDPFKRCTDSELWTALEIAHMKDTIMNLRLQLESPVEDEGENFSVGQRQLVCLARAFLARSPILFLDEATAAMDLVTDALIQATIREHFADRTIITIAHRIDTVIHSDRILVMDAGRMAEFDTPKNLLSNPNSSFSRLVSSGGKNYFDSIVRLMNNPPAKAAPMPKQDSFAGKIPMHPNMSHTEFRQHSHANLQLPDPDAEDQKHENETNNGTGSPLTVAKPAATISVSASADRREVMSVEVDL